MRDPGRGSQVNTQPTLQEVRVCCPGYRGAIFLLLLIVCLRLGRWRALGELGGKFSWRARGHERPARLSTRTVRQKAAELGRDLLSCGVCAGNTRAATGSPKRP